MNPFKSSPSACFGECSTLTGTGLGGKALEGPVHGVYACAIAEFSLWLPGYLLPSNLAVLPGVSRLLQVYARL